MAGLPQVIPAGAGAVALLVPVGIAGPVARNGVPVCAGVHVLRHGDRVDFAEAVYWVADDSEVHAVAYEAAVHGEDQFCFLTRVRLRAGEMVVVCPGRPGAVCAAIYRKAAWDLAQETNTRFRCPRCGFEPSAAQWQPPLPAKSGLSRLLQMARQTPPGER
ncbi:MAG: hypothetical protein AB7U20_14390 [Planctomycetaceae bacterium]